MTATFINKQYDGRLYYHDLIFSDDSGNLLLRLGGVIFNNEPSRQDYIDRATEIAELNFSNYELTLIN